MENITSLLVFALEKTIETFSHNWLFLLASIMISVVLKMYLKPDKISAFLMRHRGAGTLGATAVAVTTPLCSCGTMAVLLGMMANTMPWAPIIAFMVASPLTSPQELIYSAGLFGWRFAVAFFASSILLGLVGGLVGAVAENRGWLANQTRFHPAVQPTRASLAMSVTGEAPECSCQSTPKSCDCDPAETSCGCSAEIPESAAPDITPMNRTKSFLKEFWQTGKTLVVLFAGFAFVGYLINGLIPAEWMANLFGSGKIYGVPLAATLGLPFYLNTEASMPLLKGMIDAGMSHGAALAFLITGAGTSIGAVTGALMIARWRVISVVIGTLWVGAIVLGSIYNLVF